MVRPGRCFDGTTVICGASGARCLWNVRALIHHPPAVVEIHQTAESRALAPLTEGRTYVLLATGLNLQARYLGRQQGLRLFEV